MGTDFVTIDIARLLKVKGYHEFINTFAEDHGIPYRFRKSIVRQDMNNIDEHPEWVSVPSFWEALRWIRENHKLFIQISPVIGRKWLYEIINLNDNYASRVPTSNCRHVFKSYNDALIEGIIETLKLI